MPKRPVEIAELCGEIACTFYPTLTPEKREKLASTLIKLSSLTIEHAIETIEERIRNGTLRRLG